MELYLGKRCRCADGEEAMAMQCIHFGPKQHLLANYTSDFLNDMAGNAFNAYSFATMFVCKEILLAILWKRAKEKASADKSAADAETFDDVVAFDELPVDELPETQEFMGV